MKRRGPKHPGVVFLKPNPKRRTGWRARYVDPDTERTTYETLDSALTTLELRAQWAVAKSEELQRRRIKLDEGAVRATGAKLAKAVSRYYDAHPHLGEKTLAGYTCATKRFLEWADRSQLESCDDLDRAKLAAYWETLVAEPKRTAVKNGKRGEYAPAGKRRGPLAINRDIRSLGTVLRFLVDRDLFPKLRMDDIRRALKKLDVPKEEPVALKPAELNQLLAVANAYDALTFEMTRKDKEAGTRNTTAKYTPIYPLVLGLLLSGMRFDEACTLTWDRVDLDDGTIRLRGASVKTKHARTIDLSVSPALHALLTELKPEKDDLDALVFGVAYDEGQAAGKRLKSMDGCPKRFTWKALRSTCGSYLTNAPGIFGAASAYRSAKQLGHSVVVAEKHYVGVVKVPKDATTLEDAMGLKLTELKKAG